MAPARQDRTPAVPPGRCVLFNLVGEQPMPCLIPILQYRPDVVVFLYSPRTASQVADVCAALDLAGGLALPRCVEVEIDPARFIRSAGVVREVMAGYPGGRFLFNLSGGTKLMAISLYRAAEGKGEIVYVSADDECVLCLLPEDVLKAPITASKAPQSIALRDRPPFSSSPRPSLKADPSSICLPKSASFSVFTNAARSRVKSPSAISGNRLYSHNPTT